MKKAHLISGIVLVAVIVTAVVIHFSTHLKDHTIKTDVTQNADTKVNITNYVPVASGTDIDSGATSINLSAGQTTSVACTATLTDNNSCTEISAADAVLYRTNIGGGATCSTDANNCYNVSCVISDCTGPTDTAALATCTFSVEYYADPTDPGSANAGTDWTCQITPTDGGGAGTADSKTIEMATTRGLDVTDEIDYGTLALAADTGATNQLVTIRNTGNEDMDPEISGTDMACTVGSIPVANLKYDQNDVTYASLSQTLAATAATYNLTLPQRTNGVVTDDVYWGLSMPTTGVGGSCTGQNTFTAVSGI